MSARSLFNASVSAGSPLAHWTLDENSGAVSLVDRIGGYNLVPSAGVTVGVADGLGKAITFDKSLLAAAARPQHDVGLELAHNVPKTIEVVCTPNVLRSGATTRYALCSDRLATGTLIGWELYLQWNNTLGITQVVYALTNASNTTWRINCDTVDIPNGELVHIQLTLSGAVNSVAGGLLRINGVQATLVQSGAWGAPGNPSAISINTFPMLGAAGNATKTDYYNGTLHEVMLFPSQRTQDEAIYRASLAHGRAPEADAPATAKNLILSIDLYDDCDDLTDIQVAAQEHLDGRINIIAAVADSCGHYSAACIDAILRANGITVPVGAYKGVEGPGSGDTDATAHFTRTIATDSDFLSLHNGAKVNYPDAVDVVRQALADLPSGEKAKIVMTGMATVVQGVLASPADGISALTGEELIEAKIDRTIWAAGASFTGSNISNSGSYNMAEAPVAAEALMSNWPASVPFIIQSNDVGGALGSGGGDLVNSTAVSPPVKSVSISPTYYGWTLTTSMQQSGKRPAWGGIAILTASRGNRNWTHSIGVGGHVAVNSGTGASTWRVMPASNHSFQRRTGLVTAATISAEIEALIAARL